MMPSTHADILPTPPATTLSYDQSAQLSTDLTFRGRIKIACLHFANYIIDEAPSTTAHNSRYKWAQQCYQNPDMTAGSVQQPTVIQPPVQSEGTGISDADLQTAVETTIQSML